MSSNNGTFKALAYGAAVALGGYGVSRAISGLTNYWADRVVSIITQDPYAENWFEAVSQFRRVGLQEVIETDLRATSQGMLLRPFGTPKSVPNLHGLMFNLAQLGPLPTDHEHPVNTRVTLGKEAKRPLTIELPILMGGIGYGVFLSREAKIAVARGVSRAGTAANTGEGPFLPQEREEASKLIVQYHRGNWMRLETLQHADAVEIHIGQGAQGSVGLKMPPEKVSADLRTEMGIEPGEDAVMYSTFAELAQGRGLSPLIERARHLSEGAPVFVKIAASHRIESDLELIVRAGADGVVIDGAQAGTGQAAPIAQDDFGIPTLFALVRARKYLDQIDPTKRLSLIVAGGLYTPGDFLKCLALGADAVSVATVVMLALLAGQQQIATPGEPPTQAITYQGLRQAQFDAEKGADNVAQFFEACRLEMGYGLRLLGKDDVHDLSPADLCALDDETAKITGVDLAYKSPQEQRATPNGEVSVTHRRR